MLFGAVDWDWGVIAQTLPYLLKASVTTIELAVISIFFGLIIGLVVALMKISHIKVFQIFGQLYTWIFRGIPLLVQLFLIYFGLSAALGIDLDSFVAAIIGISICGGAYIAEIIRSCILSIDPGQMEAALSLGMDRRLAMRKIVIPQTYRRLIPPLGNEFINLIKDTALASTITVTDLLRTAQIYSGSLYKPFEMYVSAAVIYLILITVITLILNYAERRLTKKGF
ncbi:MAG: amino acid ABC transporter permease [Peptococcaceae bacterium]|nr:amino acid ABC transporter permease [Peptococcaceae bacterium]